MPSAFTMYSFAGCFILLLLVLCNNRRDSVQASSQFSYVHDLSGANGAQQYIHDSSQPDVPLVETGPESKITKSIPHIQDETHLYSILTDTASTLVTRVGSPKFIQKVAESGQILVVSKIGDNPPISVIILTVNTAQDPFLTATALIGWACRWYSYQHTNHHRLHRNGQIFNQLLDLLCIIRNNPNRDEFHSLIHMLRTVFPGNNNDLKSPYMFWYYWCYYVELIRFMGEGKLAIVTNIGEGTI